MMKSKSDYASTALSVACDQLRDAINRRSAIKRAHEVYYGTRRPAYVDGVILYEKRVK